MKAVIVKSHEITLNGRFAFAPGDYCVSGLCLELRLEYDHAHHAEAPGTVQASLSFNQQPVYFAVKNSGSEELAREIFLERDLQFDENFGRVQDSDALRSLLASCSYLNHLFGPGFELQLVECDAHSYEHILVKLKVHGIS